MKSTILVIDDDHDILHLCTRLLTSLGYQVETATDGLKAVDLFNKTQTHVDLILCDGKMPNLSGFDLVKNLKSSPRGKGIGIFMLTGLKDKKSIERAAHLGVNDYIVKPIDPMVLAKKIDNYFKAHPSGDTSEAKKESA